MHDLSAPASYIAPLVVWMLLNREETSSSVLVWFFYVLQQSIGVFSDRILPSGTWWEVVDKEKEVELKDHSVNSSIKRATQRIKWYYSSCLFWFSVAVIEHSEQKPLRGNRVYFRSHFLVTSITEGSPGTIQAGTMTGTMEEGYLLTCYRLTLNLLS